MLHTHQPIATIFGDLEKPILSDAGHHGAGLPPMRGFPIYQSARKVTTTEQGAEVARVMGDKADRAPAAITGSRSRVRRVEEVAIWAIWLEHEANSHVARLDDRHAARDEPFKIWRRKRATASEWKAAGVIT